MFSIDRVLFVHNVYDSHWKCAVILMGEKIIQYYDSMVSYVHAYTTGIIRYLKDEWAVKKGGELPDVDKYKIVGAVDGLPQQKNGFDCGVFACMFS